MRCKVGDDVAGIFVSAKPGRRHPETSEAVTLENDAMPGAQFFLNEQEENAVTEAARAVKSF